ncbi:MAG: NAD(P)-dependent alcohol dehydrogenase [Gammaproteobacteria bacterium]|nr:NAD(P)-dependent alcohol dehydrogenase [Gammaproteobacteria bacterium]
MKAIICRRYGMPDVLQLQEIEKPVAKANEVLVKIHAASVTRAEGMMRRGSPLFGRLFMGITKPKYPVTGTGFAGEIEALGEQVTQFQIGDKVFGESVFGLGTNAEYVVVAEDGVIAFKPKNISYAEAAPICDGALTALNFLQIGKLKKGQRVLINGAAGSLGSAAVQLAHYFGAEVTGVCSDKNAAWVADLGAATVLNYQQTDFTQLEQKYDVIFDSVGKRSFSECKRVLTKQGVYLSPVLSCGLLFDMILRSIFGSKKAKFSATGVLPVPKLRSMLEQLRTLFEADVIKSVMDRDYPLEQAAEAHRYVDQGHKKGNVVVMV